MNKITIGTPHNELLAGDLKHRGCSFKENVGHSHRGVWYQIDEILTKRALWKMTKQVIYAFQGIKSLIPPF